MNIQNKKLLDGVLHGSLPVKRRSIAKTITLLESTRVDHREQADALLTELLPHSGNSLRIGISGVPGVGKSTFIEALGKYVIEQGHKVAVLAVDPSSNVSGGSILGDKTRMEELCTKEEAYIRPSPNSGTLGGVAGKTREAMLVCEAAGYDVVVVETVGVGQSEIAVASMTDMFVLLKLPNAGDDLQGIKKGVMEVADLVVINKADIDPHAAMRAQAQMAGALRLYGQVQHALGKDRDEDEAHIAHDQFWKPRAIQVSALNNSGVDALWQRVQEFERLSRANGRLAKRRQSQAQAWMWERIASGLRQAFEAHPLVAGQLQSVSEQVKQGVLPASVAARRLLDGFSAQSVS